MSKHDFCKYCESPFDGELDENGNEYCDCDGATIEKLEQGIKEAVDIISDLRRYILTKHQVVGSNVSEEWLNKWREVQS